MPRAVVVTKLDHAARRLRRGAARRRRRRSATRCCRSTVPMPRRRRGHRRSTGCSAGDRDERPRAGALIEGDHRGVRGRDADGPLPRRRGGRRGRCWSRTWRRRSPRGTFHPGGAGLLDHRRRLRRAARPVVRGFPSPPEHPPPEVFTPAGAAAGTVDLRPRRPAGGRGGEDDQRPVRRAASAWSGSSPAPSTPTQSRARLRPLLGVLRRGLRPRRTTTRTSGSAPWPIRSAASRCRPTGWSRATSAPSAGCRRAETGDTLSGVDQPLVLQALVDARAAAAGRDRGRDQVRRGQALHRARPAGRRGPEPAHRAERRRPASSCSG